MCPLLCHIGIDDGAIVKDFLCYAIWFVIQRKKKNLKQNQSQCTKKRDARNLSESRSKALEYTVHVVGGLKFN